MTGSTTHEGGSLELDYKDHAIRALMIDGVPWFALEDLVAALGWRKETVAVVDGANFPPWAKRLAGEGFTPAEIESSPGIVLLSPVGVFYWGMAVDGWKAQSITAWAKRAARDLCPSPTPDDPAMALTLIEGADGWTFIPPGPPPKFSGWRSAWYDLKDYSDTAWRKAESRNLEINRKAREAARAAEGASRGPLGLGYGSDQRCAA